MVVWKVLAITLSVVLMLVGGYYAYWVIRAERSEAVLKDIERAGGAGQANLRPPADLNTAYDPSVNSGVFGINSWEAETGEAELIYKWPETRVGQSMRSEIVCQDYPIKVMDPGATVPRLVTRQGLLKVMDETPADRLLLVGRCNDVNCTRIVGDCQLTIKEARRENGE